MPRHFYYRKGHLELARRGRKDPTPMERKLWYGFLRGHTPRFYRQREVGNFILDFYCAAAKLAVEVDGESHFTEQGLAYDAERTTYLEALGIRVLRFTNLEVARNFGGVCETIERQTAERLEPQPCFKP